MLLKIYNLEYTKKICFVLPIKIHNRPLKGTTVTEKTDLRSNFIIRILTRTGLHTTFELLKFDMFTLKNVTVCLDKLECFEHVTTRKKVCRSR